MKTNTYSSGFANYLISFVKGDPKVDIKYNRANHQLFIRIRGSLIGDYYFSKAEYEYVMKAKKVYESKRRNKKI